MVMIEDLSLGNIVKCGDKIVKICQISSDFEVMIKEEDFGEEIKKEESDISPIRITDDILIKNGFKHNKRNDTFFKDTFLLGRVDKYAYGIFVDCEDDWYSYVHQPYMKYVHELQNCYRLITKKDLEIKV